MSAPQTGKFGQLPTPDRHRIRGNVRASLRSRWRLLSLVIVHLAAAIHIAHWKITGSTLTPVEPSEAMQTLELGHVNAGFILFVILILATLVLGRFFCGWACHVVAYQDAAAWLLGKLRIRPRPVRSRLLVFIPFAAAFYMFVWPSLARALSDQAMPSVVYHLTTEDYWQTFPGLWIGLLTIAIDGFLVVYLLGAKGFCTYGCPYGAFFGIADRFAIGKIRVTDDCEQCGHCTETCTSNIRVHEEVAKFKMVMDSNCMKCLDCVSVCPKNALYYGKSKPSFFSLGTVRKKKRRVYDFTWPEEIAMAVVFTAALYAWRGLYEMIPFLLAVGLAVITAIGMVLLWRLLRFKEFSFQHHILRRGGRLTRAGAFFTLVTPLYLVLTAHSGAVQLEAREGERLLLAAEVAEGSEREDLIAGSLAHLQRAESWGLVPVGGLHLKIGSILRERGELLEAEEQMRIATQVAPDLRTPWIELSRLLMERDAWDEAERVLEGAVASDPDHALAQDWLHRLQSRPR